MILKERLRSIIDDDDDSDPYPNPKTRMWPKMPVDIPSPTLSVGPLFVDGIIDVGYRTHRRLPGPRFIRYVGS